MSRESDLNAVLALFWASAALHKNRYWFDRVASLDNPADTLTKGGLDSSHLAGAVDDTHTVDWDSVFGILAVILSNGSMPTWNQVLQLFSDP